MDAESSPEGQDPAASMLAKLDLLSIETLVQQSRLRWYGHVQRCSDWINNITTFEVEGTSLRGRPKKTWAQTVRKDVVCWGLKNIDPTDRNIWRQAIQTKQRVKPAQLWKYFSCISKEPGT